MNIKDLKEIKEIFNENRGIGFFILLILLIIFFTKPYIQGFLSEKGRQTASIEVSQEEVNSTISTPNNKILHKQENEVFNQKINDLIEDLTPLKEPTSIEIFENYETFNGDYIEEIRKKNKLRPLTTFESGKKITEMPSGTYFFTLIGWISNDSDNFHKYFPDYGVQKFGGPYGMIEIQRRNDNKFYLIGFTNKSQASNISYLNGRETVKVLLSPLFQKDLPTLVQIPVSRIISAEDRDIEITPEDKIMVLDIELK